MVGVSFSQKLLLWYDEHARDLPWRQTQDPYCVWISEMMLQQTTVAAVIPYYEKWMRLYPKVSDVAVASWDDLLKVWEGLGYYRRVKHIHQAAKIIVQEHQGHLPQTRDALRHLPGFGPYTTGAVLSIAYDQREPLVDANVRRLAMRLMALPGAATTAQDAKIYKFLDEIMPHARMRAFNQALMEIGALICRSKAPRCLMCPLKQDCRAYAQGAQESIPEVQKKKIQKIDAAIAVIEQDDKVFIQKRTTPGLLQGLWEFPGGKQEPDEPIEDTLKREVHEELGVGIGRSSFFVNVKHCYTNFQVKLHVFRCEVDGVVEEDENRQWVRRDQLKNYAMPAGSVKIVEHLLSEKAITKKVKKR